MAGENNRYDRRLKIRSSAWVRGPEVHGFRLGESASVDENLFTERAWAQPNYHYTRSIPQNTTDTDLTSTVPAVGDVMDLNGYSSVVGYVVLGTIAAVDVELWLYDAQNDNWYLADTASSVASQGAFDFTDQARNHKAFIRCGTATGSGETVAIYATGL